MKKQSQKYWGKLEFVSESQIVYNLYLEKTIIGSDNISCNIVIDDSYVGKQHCIITYVDDDHLLMLTTVGDNVAYVNGEKVTNKSVHIRHDDFIVLCNKHGSVSDGLMFIYKFNKNILKRPTPENPSDNKHSDTIQENENYQDERKMNCQRIDELKQSEFTCCICQAVIHKCVTIMPCQHNFCGGCLSWRLDYSKECPECREDIKFAKKNAKMNSLLEIFLKNNPGLKRPTDELKDIEGRDTFKDGLTKYIEKNGSSQKYEKQYKEFDFYEKCLECESEAPDGFTCLPYEERLEGGPIHIRCSRCDNLFPDRKASDMPTKCLICNKSFCTQYFSYMLLENYCTMFGLKMIRDFKGIDLEYVAFKGLWIEKVKFQEYLSNKNLKVNDVLKYIKAKYMKGGKFFEYFSEKKISFEGMIKLNENSPVCSCCFTDKVWPQFVIKYHQDMKPLMEDYLKNRENCKNGLNCKFVHEDIDHAKKLDHFCLEKKF